MPTLSPLESRSFVLVLVLTLAGGCEAGYQPPTWPEGSMRIRQGTVANVGACRVGNGAVSDVDASQPWVARLTVVHPQPGASGLTSVSITVREGDLLPLCGGLYPVTGIEPDRSDDDGNPADARGAVVLAPTPVAVAGVELAADSMVVPVNARVGFVAPSGTSGSAQLSAELSAVVTNPGAPSIARFETWPGVARSLAMPGDVRTVEVTAGDHLPVLHRRYRVLAIQPTERGRKLLGWVELTGLPVL